MRRLNHAPPSRPAMLKRFAAIGGLVLLMLAGIILIPVLAQTGDTGGKAPPAATPPPAPPPLSPQVQDFRYNPFARQQMDTRTTRNAITAEAFRPTVRAQIGDVPQPPADAIPPDAVKGQPRPAEGNRLAGVQQSASAADNQRALESSGWVLHAWEDFEGRFDTDVSCGGAITATWQLLGDGGYTWGDNSYRPFTGSWAAWPAAKGANALDPWQMSPVNYPNNMNSWMICGPFDFSDAIDVYVDFNLYLDTEYGYDYFWFGASVDNQTYDWYYWTGWSEDQWLYEPMWLDNYVGQPQVWLAWAFTSDVSNPVPYEGAWIDDITIWSYDVVFDDAGNLIEDGSFENGGAGWSAMTTAVASRYQAPSLDELRNPENSYITDLSAVDGTYSAVMFADGELNDYLYQPISVPTGTTNLDLDFWFAVTTDEANSGADWFCAGLADAGLTTLIVDLGCMDATDSAGYWQEVLYSFSDSEVAAAEAGGGVWLIFELYNRGGSGSGTAAWVDYVQLYATGGDGGAYVDPNEPNNNPNEATALSCSQTISGTVGDVLGTYGDEDWFALRGVPAGRLDIDINARSLVPASELDSVVYLLDGTGSTVLAANDDDGATYDSYLVYTNTVTSNNFYVVVTSYDGYGGPDSNYQMTTTCGGAGGGPPPGPTTTTGPANTWNLMLYLNAEDAGFESILQQYIRDMETVLVGKTDFLTITVLYDGASSGDTVRCVLQPSAVGTDGCRLGLTGVYTNGVNRWPLSEQNVGDGDTLASFVGWSMDNYPAENTYLAIDDHGHGVYGISWDKTNGNDSLTPPEVYSALKAATNNGARKISIMDYEACLMGMAETAYDVKDWVDYTVFFEQISWGLNTYPVYFGDLAGPDTPSTVGTRIINRYHTEADTSGYPHTISLIDTSQMGAVKQTSTNLALALQANFTITDVRSMRGNSQAFAADNDATNPALADYIDLWDFASQPGMTAVLATEASAVRTAVDNAVVIQQVSSGSSGGFFWDHSGAHGLSIYYPASNASSAFNDYIAERIFQMSNDDDGIDGKWDEFLAWAVTTGGNGVSNGLGGDDRKGMIGGRFLQPKLSGNTTFVYLPLVLK